jgi:hypothetical protein
MLAIILPKLKIIKSMERVALVVFIARERLGQCPVSQYWFLVTWVQVLGFWKGLQETVHLHLLVMVLED